MMQEYLVQKRRLEPASINFWRTPARICPVPFAETSERGQRDSRRKKRLKSSFKVNGGETIAFEVPKPQEAAIEGGKYPVGHFV